jgi:hypothetical protein
VHDIDLQPGELGGDLGEALVASLPPATLDRDGATFDPTEFSQSLHKSGEPFAIGRRRVRTHVPDGRQLARLLRARRERPHRRRAEQGDELPTFHSINSSARWRRHPGHKRHLTLTPHMGRAVVAVGRRAWPTYGGSARSLPA